MTTLVISTSPVASKRGRLLMSLQGSHKVTPHWSLATPTYQKASSSQSSSAPSSRLRRAPLPPDVSRVASKEEEAAMALLVAKSFAGSAEAAPELGLDWVLGPFLKGKWSHPLRLEVLLWMMQLSCTTSVSRGGLALTVAHESHTGVKGMALCSVNEKPIVAGNHKTFPIPALPGFEGAASRCPQGHALASTVTPRPNFRCDDCGRQWAAGKWLLACRACDYDLCQECQNRKASGSLRSSMNGRLEVLSRVQLERHERHLLGPHLHIGAIAVDPECQGKGLCSKLMRAVCEVADHEGLPTYIETSGLRNVNIYSRFGFRTVEEYNVSWPQDPEHSDVLQSMFAMVRPASSLRRGT